MLALLSLSASQILIYTNLIPSTVLQSYSMIVNKSIDKISESILEITNGPSKFYIEIKEIRDYEARIIIDSIMRRESGTRVTCEYKGGLKGRLICYSRGGG